MAFDFFSNDIANALIKTCEIESYDNNYVIKYVHEDKNVIVNIHKVIYDDVSILYAKLLNNCYDDTIINTIPYVLIKYFNPEYIDRNLYIWYTDDENILKQYQLIVGNMPLISYYNTDFNSKTSKKYHYMHSANCTTMQVNVDFNDIIDYMDNNL